jgi:hypothetical protein
MPAAAGGGCLKPNTFAFANGVDPSNNNKNYIGVAVGDPTHSSEFAPVVEKITFSDPLKADGSPTFTGLEYIAGSVTAPRRMPSCAPSGVLDPTNTADYGLGAPSDLLLAHAYTAMRTSDTGAPVLPGSTDTACLISITITGSSGTPGTGTLTAYAYFAADSKAWPT